MSLTHLGCPSCGGTLSLAEGQRLVACQYCGGESLVSVPGAVPRYAVMQGVSQEEARAAAQRLLVTPGLPRGLRERGRIQDVSLCYVPFYEFTGTRLGTFFLREKEKSPAPLTGEGVEDVEFQRWLLEPPVVREDTRVIQQDYVRIGPACEQPELGLDHIPLASLRRGATPVALEPFDLVALQSRAVVLAPTKAPQGFADESQWRIKVRSDRTAFVEQRLKILYYPVWQARYLFRGRPYEVAVDGVTGKVLRGRAPAEMRPAVALAVAALALGAFCFGRPGRQLVLSGVATGGQAGWVFGTLGGLLALFLAGTVASLLAWMAWTIFRQSGEMILGDEESGIQLDLGGEGGLQRIIASAMRRLVTGGSGTSKHN
ncbi:MAG TPA: hypothetical protein VLM91_21030 [Candidatus Methylomirabilis sp.]|nr:hypothetical protein [Candidatus Methylomirabilis sp.]